MAQPDSVRSGDLYWIAADDVGSIPGSAHPHVVVQDDAFNQSRIPTVVVCALTSNLHRATEPGTVLLDPGEGGLEKQSVVLASQISSVDKAKLGERIGALSAGRVDQVLAALRFLQASYFRRSDARPEDSPSETVPLLLDLTRRQAGRKRHEDSPSETVPLLLDLTRRQAGRKRPADLLSQLERDRFVHPSFLDQRLINQLDAMALGAAPEFEALHLSPVAPLGACSVVAPTSQDRTLSTTRGTEVVSDPTNVLALICAERLRRDPKTPVRLCTVHQVLRAQPLPPQPGFSRHFRLFTLAEAGLGQAEDGFETAAIARHLAALERLMDRATRDLGCHFPHRKFTLRTTPQRSVLRDRVCDVLRQRFPHMDLRTEEFESSYYAGLRILLDVETISGESCQLADLGLFDWVGKLTSNQRLRFVASGFGLQLLPVLFKP